MSMTFAFMSRSLFWKCLLWNVAQLKCSKNNRYSEWFNSNVDLDPEKRDAFIQRNQRTCYRKQVSASNSVLLYVTICLHHEVLLHSIPSSSAGNMLCYMLLVLHCPQHVTPTVSLLTSLAPKSIRFCETECLQEQHTQKVSFSLYRKDGR